MTKQDIVTEARELLAKVPPRPWRWVAARTQQHLHGPNGNFAQISMAIPKDRDGEPPRDDYRAAAELIARAPELLRQLADEVERLQKQQAKVIQLIEAKRDGGTARYAYGGYSRELWHLNVETLKTVCKELLKEVADALAFNTASNPVGSRADLDAGAVHKAEGVDHDD